MSTSSPRPGRHVSDDGPTHRSRRSPFVRWLATCLVIVTSVGVTFISVVGHGETDAPEPISLGGPNEGALENGLRLPDQGKGFLANPHTTNRGARYGTDELVRALVRMGADLDRWAPGSTLIINDLSLREGGPIPRHQSHQAGRDADFLFFMNDKAGEPVQPQAVRFNSSGRGVLQKRGTGTGETVSFDAERNWLAIRSLVENDVALLQRVFVADHLRALMLEYAETHEQPAWIIERAADVMCETNLPHDDHFHIRLFCTAEDYHRGCRDSWPIFPWRRTEMARLGIGDVETAGRPMTGTRRTRRRRATSFGRTWCPATR